jgi:hypothetical protein
MPCRSIFPWRVMMMCHRQGQRSRKRQGRSCRHGATDSQNVNRVVALVAMALVTLLWIVAVTARQERSGTQLFGLSQPY